jgi:carbamoyl-phosphate synthase large subunit
MATPLHLLLTSAGRRVELIERFRAAAGRCGIDLTVHATDLDPSLSPACHAADHAHSVARSSDPGFIVDLTAILGSLPGAIVVPTTDHDLLPLARAAEQLTRLGGDLVISDEPTLLITRDKLKSAAVLGAAGVRVPKTLALPAAQQALLDLGHPIVAKPRDGSSSTGLRLGLALAELADCPSGYIAQETIAGDEYTINAYVDREGSLRSAVPHLRISTRTGEVNRGKTHRSEVLERAAAAVVTALPGLRGPAAIQMFVTPDGEPIAIEVNARFGGGYPLTDEAGASFTELILREHLGLPLTSPDWRSGVTMLRYDQSFFLEP